MRRGFSLLELLISLALAATLALLLIFTVGNWRARSQQAVCLQHLRNIGVALGLYAGDHQNRIPPRNLGLHRESGAARPPGNLRPWPARLFNLGYVTDRDIFFCPSFFPRNHKEARRDVTSGASETYGMRIWLPPGAHKDDPIREEEKPLSLIARPGDFFLVVDSIWLDPNWESQGYGVGSSKNAATNPQKIHTRHDGRANTLFADGHVAAMEPAYFKELVNTQPEYSDHRPYSVYEEATIR